MAVPQSAAQGAAADGRAGHEEIADARLDKVISALRELMQLIVQGASLKQTLTNIALTTERLEAVPLCAIHLVEPGGRQLRLRASPSLPPALANCIDAIEVGLDGGPIAAAAQERKPVVITDLERDPRAAQLHPFASQSGLAACRVEPIESQQGQLLGTFTLFCGAGGLDSPEQNRILDLVASLVEFAVSMDQRERSQRLVNDRFASLTATIPGVIYQRRVTAEGDVHYTYISEGARDLFGVSPEEILADPDALFVCHGPQYRATFKARLLEASRKLEMWDVEAQIITRDGQQKWTHAIARPKRQSDGSVLWDGVILDATRSKQAELDLRRATNVAEATSRAHAKLLDQLRTANERFTALAGSIPGVVYQRRVTPDGEVSYTYISEGVTDLFGLAPEDVLADPNAIFERLGPEYRRNFRERLLAASRKLEMWDVEVPIVTRDGQKKWTHAIARPKRQADGTVLWDGVILDATRIKEAELELRDAKQRAEASSQAKSRFLAQISHELRTPLNAIIGFSEILQNESLGPIGNPAYRDYAQIVNQSGARLLDMINDILEFTKLENDQLTLREEAVAVAALFDDALSSMAEEAERAAVKLERTCAPDLPGLWADGAKLKKILTVLLSNAIKFTPSDGRVRLLAAARAGGGLVLTVEDTGIGIADSDLPKMMAPFGQVEGDLNRCYDGLGLGVPLAMILARLHGAELIYDSQVERGTRVRLILPPERVMAGCFAAGAQAAGPS